MAMASTCARASKRSATDLNMTSVADTTCGSHRARATRRRTADSLEAEREGAKVSPGVGSSSQTATAQVACQPTAAAAGSAVVGAGGCVMGVPCKGIPKPIPGPVLGVPQLPLPSKGYFPMGFPMGMPPPAVMMLMMQQQMASMSAAMMGGMANPFIPTGGCSMPSTMGMPVSMPPMMGPGFMPSMGAPALGCSGYATPYSSAFATSANMPTGVPTNNGFLPTSALPGQGATCMHSMPTMSTLQLPSLACPAANQCSSPATGTDFELDSEGKQNSSPSHAHTDSSRNSSAEQLALADQDFASFISSFLVPGADAPSVPPTGDPVLDLHLDLSDLMEGGEGLTSGPLGLTLSHDTLLEALAST